MDWWYGPSLLNNHWARWPKLYNILFSCCGDPDPRPCCLRSRWRRSRRTWRSTATSSTLRIRWDKVKQAKSWWVNFLFIRIKKVFFSFFSPPSRRLNFIALKSCGLPNAWQCRKILILEEYSIFSWNYRRFDIYTSFS